MPNLYLKRHSTPEIRGWEGTGFGPRWQILSNCLWRLENPKLGKDQMAGRRWGVLEGWSLVHERKYTEGTSHKTQHPKESLRRQARRVYNPVHGRRPPKGSENRQKPDALSCCRRKSSA